MRKLTIDDISDLREYERTRDEFRRSIIELKKRRRVALGDIVTLVFENVDTMRWQVQEMARVERMLRDEQIAHEVATYNELIPDDGELSATLFVELDSQAKLREWLPKLVGIHESVMIVLPDGEVVRGIADDADRLTRDDVTPAVHFLRFRFSPAQVDAFRAGPVAVRVDHPEYRAETTLDDVRHAEIASDFTS
ncbi:MAG TPA: DUF3501 family protein [Acidimicrobiia bacterium]|nr:DUF3501 family protein [Acidimicrobiia bacterium]